MQGNNNKKNDFIKIKKYISGFDGNAGFRNLYVQLTQDNKGTSLSIEEYTIPLEPLGIKLQRAKN